MLARYVSRKLTFYDESEQAQIINLGRDKTYAGLTRVVSAFRQDEKIGLPEDDAMIVQLIFDIYQAESRRWLQSEQPRLEFGLNVLRRVMGLLISGLGVAKNMNRQ